MATVGININEINFDGLRRKPTYEELIEHIANDKERIRYPDRRATFTRNHPYMTQLDGETLANIESQQFEALK